jgi:peptidoglycan hydrolase-like protein with peptidoglycan-binding domain
LFYSPRTYYSKKEIWLCHNCYQARSRRRRIRVIGGVAILLMIAMLAGVFSRGKSTNAAKPQAVADSTDVFTLLQGTNKLNPPPSDIAAVQNRLIELSYLKGPADGVWGTKSRTALRAFKVANGLAADDKWDALVSGRLYSTQAARSPLPLATTSPAQ